MDKKISLFDYISNLDFRDLFFDGFIKDHTSFETFDDFLLNFGINSEEDLLNSIKDKSMDEYVSKNSEFNNFKEMFEKAMTYNLIINYEKIIDKLG